ncbi:esterase/lipase family protein [Protaetiibacter larvae]|uniref:Alpha/beta hydrolase n=1 Tax=Protaetiibacter larvae TaxID=2592654 RepID=A0A5C1Y951_9MICO|nr:alpha/beta hydrolase [Protaetiibacter larvae]QEO09775.1 alpha/beta hydrolase [Protaetiibacter larvae]
MSILRHAAAIVGDFPNALRFRARALRDWPVPSRYAEGGRAPVVLVPGVYETWHYLRPVADALNVAGHPVHIVPGLGINHRPIPETAARVWARIRELELRDVVIVAHSKGGIVGKHLLARDDVEGRIARVVAIATPFHGSRMAHLAVPPAMREFRPVVPVIAELEREAAANARIVSIAPAFDPHIPEGSALDGARNLTVDVTGHFRILHDARLPLLVVEEAGRP